MDAHQPPNQSRRTAANTRGGTKLANGGQEARGVERGRSAESRQPARGRRSRSRCSRAGPRAERPVQELLRLTSEPIPIRPHAAMLRQVPRLQHLPAPPLRCGLPVRSLERFHEEVASPGRHRRTRAHQSPRGAPARALTKAQHTRSPGSPPEARASQCQARAPPAAVSVVLLLLLFLLLFVFISCGLFPCHLHRLSSSSQSFAILISLVILTCVVICAFPNRGPGLCVTEYRFR